MKKNFRLAAIALCAVALMTACNNNATEEVVLDTTPIDTVVEEVMDTVVEEEAPAAEEVAPAPAKKKTTEKKKTTSEEIKEGVKVVTAAGVQVKKDAASVAHELEKGKEGVANADLKNASTPAGKNLPGKRKAAADAIRNN